MSGKKKISFRPIPYVKGAAIPSSGYTALTIYPPGTFMGNKQFDVFVGGCGVGERKTKAAAEAYLLAMALRECDRRVAEGQRLVEHYERERSRLIDEGLVLEPEL